MKKLRWKDTSTKSLTRWEAKGVKNHYLTGRYAGTHFYAYCDSLSIDQVYETLDLAKEACQDCENKLKEVI